MDSYSSVPYVNIPDLPCNRRYLCPSLKKAGHTIASLDADAIAKGSGFVEVRQHGHSRGCILLHFPAFRKLENGVRQLFSRKGEEVVDLNLKALRAGRDAAGSH